MDGACADVESVRLRSVTSKPSQNKLACKNRQSGFRIITDYVIPGENSAGDLHGHDAVLARPPMVWLIILILHMILVSFVELRNGSYPEPLSDVKASTDMFSEERARIYLSGLTKIGSRIVGSVANERKTVDYILNEINKIAINTNPEIHALEVDLQNARGSFDLDFLGGFTNVYENIKNIVVRIGSAKKQLRSSLLINCHYDTFILTPGASDDAVSCAIMLEVLRVLSKQKQEMENSIIFLFNGAEENILQGSHAFVTSHPWFKQVKAFINLEAAGAGGKELFFQAAPNHLWLLNFYATHVPHPYASSIAQEIFQSGAVQSDTDFRIFRDFGKLSGIDIAYIRNGFFYHTKHDTPDKIPPGCIQRGGDNLLSLAKGLGQAPDLYVLMSVQQTEYVFFDLLGYFLIYFEANYLFFLNIITSLFVYGTLLKDVFRRKTQTCTVLWQVTLATISIVCSWLAALLLSSAAALMMDFIGCAMTWYTSNWLLIGLYTSPSLAASVLVMKKLKQHWLKEKMSTWQMQDVMTQTTMIIISTVLFWLSWKRVASSFPLLLLLISLLFKSYVVKHFKLLQKKAVVKFLVLHWAVMIPITTLNLYCTSAIITTFIPLMGRAGASIPSDLIMAIMVSLATSYFLLYHLHLLFIAGNFKIHFAFLLFTFSFSFFLSTCTTFGFPFSSDPSYPVSQRIFLQHVNRKFHESNNQTVEDSSLMFVPLDRTSLTHLLPIKQLNISSFRPLPCTPHPYCGWAYFLPLITHMDQVLYLPVPQHEVLPKVEVKFNGVEKLLENRARFTIEYSGPERMTIYITPCNNTKLKEWNVGSGIPIPTMMPKITDKPHYFIFTSYGIQPSRPQQLVVTVEYDSDWSEGQCSLQIAIAGHNFAMEERSSLSSSLSFYLQHFPSWTSTIYSTSTYESWKL